MSWTWWDWPLTWLTNHRPSVVWCCWLGHLTRKIVSKMTYNVSSGMLNPTILYHQHHYILLYLYHQHHYILLRHYMTSFVLLHSAWNLTCHCWWIYKQLCPKSVLGWLAVGYGGWLHGRRIIADDTDIQQTAESVEVKIPVDTAMATLEYLGHKFQGSEEET